MNKIFSNSNSKYFYLVTALGLFRFFSGPAVFVLVLKELRIEALILFLLAFFSDVDGFLARKFMVTSKFGKFLDFIADFSLNFSAGLGLYLTGQFSKENSLVFFITISLYVAYIGFRLVAGKKDIIPRRKSVVVLAFFIYLTIAAFIIKIDFRFKLFNLTSLIILFNVIDYLIFSLRENEYIYSEETGFYKKISL